MVLLNCASNVATDDYFDCHNMDNNCQEISYLYAVGGKSFCTPAEAGYRIGKSQYQFLLQIHYDNPNLNSNFVDSSGVRIHYTKELRPNDAGIMAVGQQIISIPPKTESYEVVGTCPGACQQQKLDDTGIKIFSFALHAHQLGRQIWTELLPNSDESKKVEIIRDDSYDFNYQEILSVQNYVTVKQNDALRVHCVYDSMNRNTTTKFGLSTYNEMCYAIILYYPKVPDYTFCISFNKNAVSMFRDGRATAFCGGTTMVDVDDRRVLPECADDDLKAFKTTLINSIPTCDSDVNCTTTTCQNAVSEIVNHKCVDRYGFNSVINWYKSAVNITRIFDIQSTCGICTEEYSDTECLNGSACVSSKCVVKFSMSHQGVQIAAVVILFLALIVTLGIVGYKNHEKIKEFIIAKILKKSPQGYSSQLLVDEQDENF